MKFTLKRYCNVKTQPISLHLYDHESVHVSANKSQIYRSKSFAIFMAIDQSVENARTTLNYTPKKYHYNKINLDFTSFMPIIQLAQYNICVHKPNRYNVEKKISISCRVQGKGEKKEKLHLHVWKEMCLRYKTAPRFITWIYNKIVIPYWTLHSMDLSAPYTVCVSTFSIKSFDYPSR